MATNKLTDTAIKNAKPREKEYELSDGDGLTLRVRPESKVWFLRYTSPATGKRVRAYLGSYPNLTLSSARDLRKERIELLSIGTDPAQTSALLSSSAPPSTFHDLFEKWFAGHVKTARAKESDQNSIRSRFMKHVNPVAGGIRLHALRGSHVMLAIDGARSAGSMRTANLILAESRQMFGYAVARDWMQGDPTAGLKRKDAGGADNEGDRILADEELVMLRDILRRPPKQASKYYRAVRPVLPVHTELAAWWTLATLGRAIEVATLSAPDVRVKARTWTIPAAVAKNGKAHVVQLSDFALAVWSRLEATAGERYVFESKDNGYISEKEVTRRITDRQTRENPLKGRKNSTDLDLPGGRWKQHDLRRTGATIMGELGVPSDVIDRCLNHVEVKKVTRIYQRQKMLPQRQAAFEALGDHLTKLLGAPSDWLPLS